MYAVSATHSRSLVTINSTMIESPGLFIVKSLGAVALNHFEQHNIKSVVKSTGMCIIFGSIQQPQYVEN